MISHVGIVVRWIQVYVYLTYGHWEPMQRPPPIYPASEQEHHQGPLCVFI